MQVFPDRSKRAVKLPQSAFSFDKELLKLMVEVMGTDVHPRDFLTLNGDPSIGWQRVLQFAAYEKYNFFVPFLTPSRCLSSSLRRSAIAASNASRLGLANNIRTHP